MLRIWLFGSLCVANDSTDDRVTTISGRCGSLLAFLALGRGHYFNRTELPDILWTDQLVSMTAGSFNTTLWRLRRIIERPPFNHGELIYSDRCGAICMRRSESVWLDVEEFEQKIATGLERPLEQLNQLEIDDLRTGVALYKSDILTEFTDDWALREREKHRRYFLNALCRLMQICTIRREFTEAIAYAQNILDVDRLREDVHRELMQLFVWNGQRGQALRQFELCRDMLRQELAIQPMRETQALFRQIADNAISAEYAPAPTMPIPLPISHSPMSSLAPARPGHDAGACIASARHHLAAADAQLELSLQQIDH